MNSSIGSKPFAAKPKVESQIESVAANIQKSVDLKPLSGKRAAKRKPASDKHHMSFYAEPAVFELLQKMREEDGVSMNHYINKVLKKALNII